MEVRLYSLMLGDPIAFGVGEFRIPFIGADPHLTNIGVNNNFYYKDIESIAR